MDGEFLLKPFPQRLEQAAAAIDHEQDPLGEHEAAALQIGEQCDADLLILRGALPKS